MNLFYFAVVSFFFLYFQIPSKLLDFNLFDKYFEIKYSINKAL